MVFIAKIGSQNVNVCMNHCKFNWINIGFYYVSQTVSVIIFWRFHYLRVLVVCSLNVHFIYSFINSIAIPFTSSGDMYNIYKYTYMCNMRIIIIHSYKILMDISHLRWMVLYIVLFYCDNGSCYGYRIASRLKKNN